jgi:hypothetical protein
MSFIVDGVPARIPHESRLPSDHAGLRRQELGMSTPPMSYLHDHDRTRLEVRDEGPAYLGKSLEAHLKGISYS